MKKVLFVTACILLVVLCFAGCSSSATSAARELISNGTFEGNDASGWTWVHSSSDTDEPSIIQMPAGSDHSSVVGKYYVKIESSQYSYYKQTVRLEKNQYYHLTADVRLNSEISSEDALAGAFIGILDNDSVSATERLETSGFKKIEMYFNSRENTSAVVCFGLGKEGYTASGTAHFDNISLTKVAVADLPKGETFYDLSENTLSSESFDANYRSNGEGTLYMVLASVLGGLCLFAAYALLRSLMSKKGAFLSPDAPNQPVPFFKSSGFILILCELVGFALRLITVNFIYGGPTLSGYVEEAQQLASVGAAKFYFDSASTTPIGSLYLLWMLGKLADPLSLMPGGTGFSIFLKIPAVLADLVIIFWIYMLANRKYNQYISAIFAGLYAVIPTFFFLSSGWGAYTSIGVLFLLMSLTALLDKKYVRSIAFYSVSVLFSTEVLLVLPLLLAYYVYIFLKSDEYKMPISASVTASVILLYVLGIPFIRTYFVAGQPFIAVKRYCEAFLVHKGFTNNAFSVYGIFGLGAKTANTASYVFNGIFVALMMLYTGYLFFKSRSRLDLILLSAFTFAFTAIMTSAVDQLLLYFALALLLVYGMTTGDRRVLKLFGGFTMVALLNTGYTMLIGGYFGLQGGSEVFMTASDPMLIIFSIANVALLGYFTYVVYSICAEEDVKGVVVVEGNYFKYAWSVIKGCAIKCVSLFKKKKAEDTDVSQSK